MQYKQEQKSKTKKCVRKDQHLPIKGITKGEFHRILDKASQLIKKTESDSESI